MASQNGSTRLPLDEWMAFSKALRQLLSAAGVNKLELARRLQLDRRVVGAIVEGREPCPESFLIRLYERDPDGLGRSHHLSTLIELWSEASGSAPATLTRLMSRRGPGQDVHAHAGVAGSPDRQSPPLSGLSAPATAVDPGDPPATIEAETAPGPDKKPRRGVVVVGLGGLAVALLAAGVMLLVKDRSTPGGSTAQGVTRTIQIYNKVTSGMETTEDSVAFLSSKPANYCRRDDCVLDGTDVLRTGDSVTAVCQTLAARSTNGDDSTTADDQNPELYESRLWYGIRWADGRLGYLPEVWVHADDRGGLDLPLC